METGQTIVDTLGFADRLSGSSSQSSSSDESASKRHKATGTTPLTQPLNTTDFNPSNKVDVDKTLLEKEESEEVKAEKKRAKEATEAQRCEAREGMPKAIEEANLIGRKSKELGLQEQSKRAKEEAKRAKVEAKRAKKKVLALACLAAPTICQLQQQQ
jgi:hypothetical protein